MKVMKRREISRSVGRTVSTALIACSLLMPVLAADGNKNDSSKADKNESSRAVVSIDNFGKVNDHIYRGGQPKDENYQQLAAIGVKTIVDLRGDNERDARQAAESAGLKYINLGLAPKKYPQADAAPRFLEIVNNPDHGAVYVHGAGGRHRTGAMIAVYRMSVDGWGLDRAYQEMKDYDFYTSMGHGCYRDFVEDYYRSWQAQHKAEPAASTVTQTAN